VTRFAPSPTADSVGDTPRSFVRLSDSFPEARALISLAFHYVIQHVRQFWTVWLLVCPKLLAFILNFIVRWIRKKLTALVTIILFWEEILTKFAYFYFSGIRQPHVWDKLLQKFVISNFLHPGGVPTGSRSQWLCIHKVQSGVQCWPDGNGCNLQGHYGWKLLFLAPIHHYTEWVGRIRIQYSERALCFLR